jgi:hypothetical protein
MRNQTYTIFNGIEIQLTRNPDGDYKLIYRGEIPPDGSFYAAKNANNVFCKIVEKKLITNAFTVITYALYKGYKFQVDNERGDLLEIVTSNDELLKKFNLQFVDRLYYLKWVNKSEIEKIWEERGPSGYDLPMPEGLNKIEDIENIY